MRMLRNPEGKPQGGESPRWAGARASPRGVWWGLGLLWAGHPPGRWKPAEHGRPCGLVERTGTRRHRKSRQILPRGPWLNAWGQAAGNVLPSFLLESRVLLDRGASSEDEAGQDANLRSCGPAPTLTPGRPSRIRWLHSQRDQPRPRCRGGRRVLFLGKDVCCCLHTHCLGCNKNYEMCKSKMLPVIKRGEKTAYRGPPCSTVVKFVCSASAARGSPVRIPAWTSAPLIRLCCGRRPTHKVEEDGHQCELRASLPQQKEEDWQQMLAQG